MGPVVLMVVLATLQGSGCSLPPRGIQTGRVGAGLGDALVEALSPFDRRGLKLCGSGGSMVVGVDAVGGPPHRDFTDEGGAQRSARRCPCGLGAVVEGVVSDVMGEVGDQLGSLGEVVTPVGVILMAWGIPGSQGSGGRLRAGCGFGEAPVEDGGHVSGGAEVPAECGLVEVHQGMVAGFGGEGDQVGAQGRPGRLVGDAGHELVGAAVERIHDAGSDELFGGDVQPVGVALHRLMQPDRGVAELPELGGGGGGGVVAGQDLFEQFGGGAGCDGFGSDDGVRVAVADDLQVQVIGGPSAGEHGVQLLPGFLPGDQAVHGVGGDALGGMDRGRIAQLGRLGDVVGGEPGGEVAAGVPDRQVAVSADVGDGPAVAVLHPIRAPKRGAGGRCCG